MVEIAWAAVGLLAVAVFGMFGMFFFLSTKIDSRYDSLAAKIDALSGRLDARVDALSSQLHSHLEQHRAS